jgi:hypothetical protein
MKQSAEFSSALVSFAMVWCFGRQDVCINAVVPSSSFYRYEEGVGPTGKLLDVTTLNGQHGTQHTVPRVAAWSVSVHGLGHHAKLHGHFEVIPSLLDIMLLLSAIEREVRGAAGVEDALTNRRPGPSRRKQSLDSLGFADEDAERIFGGALHVVDGTGHGVAVEGVHVLLAHAQSIDQELESLVLGAVVEENVVGDGGEGLLVLGAILEVVIVNPVFLGFRLGRGLFFFLDRGARRLMSLPVSFLAGFAAVGDELATGTQQEVDVRLCAGCAGGTLRLRHL